MSCSSSAGHNYVSINYLALSPVRTFCTLHSAHTVIQVYSKVAKLQSRAKDLQRSCVGPDYISINIAAVSRESSPIYIKVQCDLLFFFRTGSVFRAQHELAEMLCADSVPRMALFIPYWAFTCYYVRQLTLGVYQVSCFQRTNLTKAIVVNCVFLVSTILVAFYTLEKGNQCQGSSVFLAKAVNSVWLLSILLLCHLLLTDMFHEEIRSRRLPRGFGVLCCVFSRSYNYYHSAAQNGLVLAACLGIPILVTELLPMWVVYAVCVAFLLLLTAIQLASLYSCGKVRLAVSLSPASVVLPPVLAAMLLVHLLARDFIAIETWELVRTLSFAMWVAWLTMALPLYTCLESQLPGHTPGLDKAMENEQFLQHARKCYQSEMVLLHRELREYASMVQGSAPRAPTAGCCTRLKSRADYGKNGVKWNAIEKMIIIWNRYFSEDSPFQIVLSEPRETDNSDSATSTEIIHARVMEIASTVAASSRQNPNIPDEELLLVFEPIETKVTQQIEKLYLEYLCETWLGQLPAHCKVKENRIHSISIINNLGRTRSNLAPHHSTKDENHVNNDIENNVAFADLRQPESEPRLPLHFSPHFSSMTANYPGEISLSQEYAPEARNFPAYVPGTEPSLPSLSQSPEAVKEQGRTDTQERDSSGSDSRSTLELIQERPNEEKEEVCLSHKEDNKPSGGAGWDQLESKLHRCAAASAAAASVEEEMAGRTVAESNISDDIHSADFDERSPQAPAARKQRRRNSASRSRISRSPSRGSPVVMVRSMRKSPSSEARSIIVGPAPTRVFEPTPDSVRRRLADLMDSMSDRGKSSSELGNSSAKINSELSNSSAKINSELSNSSAKINSELSNSSAKINSELGNSSAKINSELSNSSAKIKVQPRGRISILSWQHEISPSTSPSPNAPRRLQRSPSANAPRRLQQSPHIAARPVLPDTRCNMPYTVSQSPNLKTRPTSFINCHLSQSSSLNNLNNAKGGLKSPTAERALSSSFPVVEPMVLPDLADRLDIYDEEAENPDGQSKTTSGPVSKPADNPNGQSKTTSGPVSKPADNPNGQSKTTSGPVSKPVAKLASRPTSGVPRDNANSSSSATGGSSNSSSSNNSSVKVLVTGPRDSGSVKMLHVQPRDSNSTNTNASHSSSNNSSASVFHIQPRHSNSTTPNSSPKLSATPWPPIDALRESKSKTSYGPSPTAPATATSQIRPTSLDNDHKFKPKAKASPKISIEPNKNPSLPPLSMAETHATFTAKDPKHRLMYINRATGSTKDKPSPRVVALSQTPAGRWPLRQGAAAGDAAITMLEPRRERLKLSGRPSRPSSPGHLPAPRGPLDFQQHFAAKKSFSLPNLLLHTKEIGGAEPSEMQYVNSMPRLSSGVQRIAQQNSTTDQV
eukprot:g3059.t1